MVKLLASLKTLLFCILFGRFKRNKNSKYVTNKHSFLHTNLYISITLSTLLLNLWPITQANPVLIDHTSFDQIQFGRNIRHMPCIVKKSGRAGVCMFAIDCIKQNGTHLGTCIDRFYFGSCCQVKDESSLALELVDNTIEQNTISNFIHDSTSQQTTLFQKLGGSKIPVPQISNSSLIAPTQPASTTTTTSTLSNLITKSTTTTTTTKPSQKVTIKSTTVKPSTTQQPSKISTFQIISNNNKYTSTEPTTKKNITSSIITNIHITETKKKPIKYKPNLKNNTTMATTISTTAIINKVTESIKKTTSQAPVKTTTKPHTTKPIIQIQSNNATIDKLSTTTKTPTTTTSTNTTKTQPTTIGGTTLAIKNTTTGSTSRPYVTKSTTLRPLLVTKGTTTTTKTTTTTTKPLLIKDTTINPLYFANSTKTEGSTKEATKTSTTAVPTTTQTSTTQTKTTTPRTTTTTTTTDAPFTSSSSTTPSQLTFNKTSDLVTWSNVQTDQVTESGSQQRPSPSEWVVVSTIAPDSSNKITTETSEPNIITFTEKLTTKVPSTEATSTTDATAFTTEYPVQPEITTTNEFTFPSDNNLTSTIAEQATTTVDPFGDVKYKQICGRRNFPEPRIVGGANAAFGRWPWQVSLRQWRTSTYLHKCGAALLNENWAITAAHCVDNVPPSDLLLRLGEYDLAEEDEPYGYQERRVQIVASHPQFDPRTFEYDLALLRFYEPVIFQPNIIPICVPDSDDDFIGQTAFVTGWGRLFEDGPLPSVLQEVAVPVINNTICESMYRAAGYIEHIPHIFICAGWKKGGYDSCEGDSGGPMVLQRESDKRFVLSGVISWGIGCAEANQPGVYTRISEFRDWINQILQF